MIRAKERAYRKPSSQTRLSASQLESFVGADPLAGTVPRSDDPVFIIGVTGRGPPDQIRWRP
jgi:hypothetical protein